MLDHVGSGAIDRRRFMGRLCVAIGAFVLPMTGTGNRVYAQRAGRDCDPRRPGLFRNLGCVKEWKRRIRSRERRLSELRAEYDRLKRRNASLRRQRDAALRVLEEARSLHRAAEQRLQYYLRLDLTAETAQRRINQLIDEFDHIEAIVNAILDIEPPCVTPDDLRKRERVRGEWTFLRELRDFALGESVRIGMEEGGKWLQNQRNLYLRFGGAILEALRVRSEIHEALAILRTRSMTEAA